MNRTVYLRADSQKVLKLAIVGKGGWQSLFRRLQAGLHGRWLTISDRDYHALVRHCAGQRVGGFQRRCRAVVRDIVLEDIFHTADQQRSA